jgi:hypothetical protein
MEIVNELINRLEQLSAEAGDLRRRLSIYQEHYFNEQSKAAPAKTPRRRTAAARGA